MNAPLKTPLTVAGKPRLSVSALLPSVATLGNLAKAGIAPLLGIIAFIGFWALLAQYSEGLPGPLSTGQAALVLFADPFYDNGPNDMGIGWNILNSLGRVGVGFGLAALVGIPLGFAIGRFAFLAGMTAQSGHQFTDRLAKSPMNANFLHDCSPFPRP